MPDGKRLYSAEDRIFEIFERLRDARAFSKYFVQPKINDIVVDTELGKLRGHYAYYDYKEAYVGAFFIPDFPVFESEIHRIITIHNCNESLKKHYGEPSLIDSELGMVYEVDKNKFRQKYGEEYDIEGRPLSIKSIRLEVLISFLFMKHSFYQIKNHSN